MANQISGQSSNSNDNKRPDIPIVNPDDSGKYIQGIVLQYGYDSVSGIWGAGYSYDNGAHFFVTDTVYGRKYRQEDADRLWPYLKKYIGGTSGTVIGSIKWADILDKPDLVTETKLNQRLMGLSTGSNVVNWNSIQNKPDLVTKNYLDNRLSHQATTIAWSQVTDKPDLATKHELDDLQASIGTTSGGDTSLSVDAIASLIRNHVQAKLDPNTGELSISINDVSNGSMVDAIATKVAYSLHFKMVNGNLMTSVGGE